ncbi:MAG TPA: hypothetical protein VHX39_07995, partial [Acetobacteraceae bacterium]|nr:hypothetical protein [Acetobacteraceae bacterium]
MSGLTIRLFGGMAIRDADGTDFLPRSRKTRAIVAVLTLTAPKSSLRSHLTALLWSRRGTEQGRASLRQSVHELQGILGSSWNRILVAERHSLAFVLDDVTVDAIEAARAAASKTALLRLFEDGFLEELGGLDPAFDAWLVKERGRLVAHARIGGEAFLEEAHPREAIILTARSLLRLDPANDGAWRALIEAHIQASDRAAARFACEQWAEAMGLATNEMPPPELATFLSRIRFGSGQHKSDIRSGVMEDVQLPEGPVAEGVRPLPNGVSDRGNSRNGPGVLDGGIPQQSQPDEVTLSHVSEDVVVPERPPMRDRALPFRLMPGGVTGDRVDPAAAPTGRVAEATILPGQPETARDRAMPNVIAPAWGVARRMMPDGDSPNAGTPIGVSENRVVPGAPTRNGAISGGGHVGHARAGGHSATAEAWKPAHRPSSTAIRRPSRSSLRLGIREMRVVGPDVDAALSVGVAEEVTTA